MNIWKEAWIRVKRQKRETMIVSFILCILILVISVLFLFARVYRNLNRSLYAKVDKSIRLDGNVTQPDGYSYEKDIEKDIETIKDYFNEKIENKEAIDFTYHYSLSASLANATFQESQEAFLFGMDRNLQEQLDIVAGRGFTEEEMEREILFCLVSEDFILKEGKKVSIGDKIDIQLPIPFSSYYMDKKDLENTGEIIPVEVIGLYRNPAARGGVKVEDYGRERRIYLTNPQIYAWMKKLFALRSKTYDEENRELRKHLDIYGDSLITGKILFPKLYFDKIEDLRKIQKEVQQFAYSLEKRDRVSNTVRAEYVLVSSLEEAERILKPIEESKTIYMAFFALLGFLFLGIFIAFTNYLLQTRQKDIFIHRALGAGPHRFIGLFFLEKAYLLVPISMISFFFGRLLSKKVSYSMLVSILEKQEDAVNLSSQSQHQWQKTIEEWTKILDIPFHFLEMLTFTLLSLFFLFLLTRFSFYIFDKGKKRKS